MTTLNSIPILIIRDSLQTIPTPDIFKNLDNKYIFYACPFKIPIGANLATGTGFKPTTGNINDYSQSELILDGRGSILAIWENSYTIEQNMGTAGEHYRDNYGRKLWQVGYAYKGVIQAENTSVGFTPFIGNANFQSEFINKQATIRFYNIPENAGLINNLNKDYFRLWILPQFNVATKSKWDPNPYLDESRTLFYADSYTLQRQPDRTIAYIDITFSSINTKMNKTALQINSYIQFGGAGEPYAFPTIRSLDNTVILDKQRLQPNPITHYQIQYMGLTLMGPIGFTGRPVYESDYNDESVWSVGMNIYPAGDILPHIYQKPLHNPINLKQLPETDLVWMVGCGAESIRTKTSTQQLNALQSPFTPTDNQGYITSDYEKTLASNPNNIPYYHPDFLAWRQYGYTDKYSVKTYKWKENDKQNIEATSQDIDLKWDCTGNNYFLYQEGSNTYHDLKGATGSGGNVKYTFDWNKVPINQRGNPNDGKVEGGLATWNMLSLFLARTQLELPLSIKNFTKIDAVSFPILGSLFRALTFGFMGAGWSFSSIARRPKYPFFNCLIPAELYRNYSTQWVQYLGYRVFDSSNKQSDGTMSFQVVMSGAEDGTGLLAGYNTITMATMGSLTNIITTSLINDQGSPTTATIPTTDIGQNIQPILNEFDPTGGWATKSFVRPVINEKTRPKYPDETLSSWNKYHQGRGAIRGYYIDVFESLSSTKAPYQLKFYNLSKFPASQWGNTALKDDYCVYIADFRSVGDSNNTLRTFRNYGILSDPTFNFKDTFNYPSDLQHVQPNDGRYEIQLDRAVAPAINLLYRDHYQAEDKPIQLIGTPNKFDSEVIQSHISIPSPMTGYELEYIELDDFNVRTILSKFKSTKNGTTYEFGQPMVFVHDNQSEQQSKFVISYGHPIINKNKSIFAGYRAGYDALAETFYHWDTNYLPTSPLQASSYRLNNTPHYLRADRKIEIIKKANNTFAIKTTFTMLDKPKWRLIYGDLQFNRIINAWIYPSLGTPRPTISIEATAQMTWSGGRAVYKKK